VHLVDLVVALTVQPDRRFRALAVTSPDPPLLHRSCCHAPISMLGFDGSTESHGSTSLLVTFVPPMLPSSPSQLAIGLAPETCTSGPLDNGAAAAEPTPTGSNSDAASAIRNFLRRIPNPLYMLRNGHTVHPGRGLVKATRRTQEKQICQDTGWQSSPAVDPISPP
jgi:hypothetical protein